MGWVKKVSVFQAITEQMGLIKRRRLQKVIYLLVCTFGIIIICTQSVNAQKSTNNCRPQIVSESNVNNTLPIFENSTCSRDASITPAQALQELAQANVVYLGETHDRAQDHQLQLYIIQELHRRNPQVAIAMEMFQKPFQDAINRYLAGKLSEQELLAQTQYERRWGYSWQYYAPILRFAKEKQLPVLALNTPTEITRQVAREGLESLTPQQRQMIPPVSEIRTDNAVYRQMLATTFQQHQHAGHGNSSGFERFFLAQVLWDETMAAEVAKFVKANPKSQAIVLAGQGHIIYGYGIPSRVARRMQRQFLQLAVLLSPPQNTTTNSQQAIADYIWQ